MAVKDAYNRSLTVGQAAVYGYSSALKRLNHWKKVAYGTTLSLTLVISILLQNVFPLVSAQNYKLTPEMYTLIGESRDDASQYLKLDQQGSKYEFVVPKTTETASHEHTGRVNDAYSASLSIKAKEGVVVTDKTSNISVTLVPEFFTTEAQKVEGDHIVYLNGQNKLVYTLKYNGLKEDIIIPTPTSDELSFKFRLQLPIGVEARLDEQGNIGIYSADPTLYGNISFGSDEDRARVDKARENGKKNNLVMTIPYPIVKDANGHEYTDRAAFSLSDKQRAKSKEQRADLPAEIPRSLVTVNEYQLTLKAHNLKDLPYPISLDPTFQVSSAADFQNINLENGAQVDTTNNLIKRAALSGGVINSWNTDSDTMTYTHRRHGAAVWNGVIYVVGGDGSGGDKVEYAAINGSGINDWQDTTALPAVRDQGVGAVAYNGYLYVLGGVISGNPSSSVIYAKIKTNGTLDSWQTASSMNTQRRLHQVAAYNGYIYAIGGITNLGFTNAERVEYASVRGDGSLSSWTTNSVNLPDQLQQHAASVYNGYMYVSGGSNSGGIVATTYYGKLQSDGSIPQWVTTSSLPSARSGPAIVVQQGYIYSVGGCTNSGSCTGFLATTAYAAINADGSLGTWSNLGQSFTNGRYNHGLVSWDNTLYILGGCIVADCTFILSDTQYTTIKPAGGLHDAAFTNDSDTFASSSYLHTTVAYNGYLYVMGGCTATDCGTITNNVRYAQLNADGSIGTFTTDGDNLPEARFGHGSFAHNGYLYVVGGCNAGSSGDCSTFRNSTYYSLIGGSGNPGAWSTDSTNPFTTARFGHTALTYNGYAYVIGGCSSMALGVCINYHNDVQVATINSGGDLGSFSNEDSFSTTRFLHASVAYNGYLYVSGGYSGSFQSDTQYSAIANDGTIGSWSTDSGDFATARYGHSFTIDKGYAYVIGGCSARISNRCNTFQTNVQYAVVNNDGTLGSWASTQAISTGRFGDGATIDGGNMRVSGGCTAASSGSSVLSCTTINNQVQYNTVNNGGAGTTSTWTTDSTNAPTVRGHHQVEVINGYIYNMGGCTTGTQNGCTPVGSVEYAQIAADGSIGTWASTTAGITARKNFASFAYNGRVYVLGGYNNAASTTYTRTIQYATPAGSGDITSWTTNATNLPADIAFFAVAAYDGYVYRAGGANVTTDSAYASINSSTGEVSSWTTGTTLAEDEYNNQTVAYRGYLYSLNGNTGSPTESRTVQVASINSDHTIGAWTLTSATGVGVQEGAAFAFNGFMYRVVGFGDGTGTEFAPILPSGQIGQWQRTTSLTTSRSLRAAPVWNGRVYVIGGINSLGNHTNAQEYATLNSIPRSGSFSKLYDFDVGVKPTKLITRGSKQSGAVVGVNYSNAVACSSSHDQAQTITDTGYTGANAQSLTLGSARTLARCFLLRYTINDNLSAVFPDSGQESTITDFDVYFTANPGKRLRGGRTFTNGVNRGLGVQP